jgi:NADH-quinone oxidoreductase subunit G
VLLVGFEPEEESPIVFLRLRKAMRKRGLRVWSLAPFATRGLSKLKGTLLSAAPGTVPEWLNALSADEPVAEDGMRAAEALRQPGAVVLVGERAAAVPGTLSAVLRLARATGARTAWIPRRAGERGAVEAGALPGLLPGGRPALDPSAREEVARRWGVAELPTRSGRDTTGIVEAAGRGELGALVVGGIDPDDLPDPAAAREALARVGFVVSLEQRPTAVTELADVVLPVAAAVEKAGTFLDWEGRLRTFEAALKPDQLVGRHLHSDLRVLDMLADAMDVHLALPDLPTARAELDSLGGWTGAAAQPPNERAAALARPTSGQAVLAGWRLLLDNGSLQDGDPHLAGTRHKATARISAATAAEAGVRAGELLQLAGPAGTLELPVQLTEMPDRVVWIPLNSAGESPAAAQLGAIPGQLIGLGPAPHPVGAGSAGAERAGTGTVSEQPTATTDRTNHPPAEGTSR